MSQAGYARLLDLNRWVPPPDPFYPEAEIARAHQLRDAGARARFLAGRYLLRRFLAGELGISDPAGIPLEVAPGGKPFCPLPGSPCFNLSHTPGTVALAMSFRGPVGVDVEDTRRPVRVEALARRWFHPEERSALAEAGPETFFRIWTRKEAFLKATGGGLRGNFSQCNSFEEARAGKWIFTEGLPSVDLQLCIVAREKMGWAWI